MYKERTYEDKSDTYNPFVVLDRDNVVEICNNNTKQLPQEQKTYIQYFIGIIIIYLLFMFYTKFV